MANSYRCEELEVTLPDGLEVLVEGSISYEFKDHLEDGTPIYEELVVIEAVRPVVLSPDGVEEYSDYPFSSLQLAWKDALVRAVQEHAFDEWEAREEARRDG